jgi:hypothetical protein
MVEADVDSDTQIVPVWTLAERGIEVPDIFGTQDLTQARLSALRSVLSAASDAPIATLEAHPLPTGLDHAAGRRLPATSPLSKALSGLADVARLRSAGASGPVRAGETLYRMVVDPKVAEQLGRGLVQPMTSKSVAGGIRSAIRNSSGIVSQASFVPAVEGGAAVTTAAVAGPLILMGVAVGITAYAEYQQQKRLERIESLLEKQSQDALRDERYALEASLDALKKVTTILLDEGRIGESIGIGSADHEIGKAMARARDRTRQWRTALDGFGNDPVQVHLLIKRLPGIGEPDGEFHAQLELASLATILRRRLGIAQALEHVQLNSDRPMERFLAQLAVEQGDTSDLESEIDAVLTRFSTLKLCSPRRIGMAELFHGKDVNRYLQTADILHQLGARIADSGRATAVAIEMAHNRDGSTTVFPALAE